MVRKQDGALTLNADILHFNAATANLASALAENLTLIFHLFFCRQIFPNGLPDEYSIVTTIRARRTTKKERWYLWQVFDQAGGSQVSQAASGREART